MVSITNAIPGTTTIPASRLHVARFAFLHTPGDMRNDGRVASLPYPEIVERVRVPQSFKAGESSLFRLYVDTRGANPGDYSGELAVKDTAALQRAIDAAGQKQSHPKESISTQSRLATWPNHPVRVNGRVMYHNPMRESRVGRKGKVRA